MSKPIIDDERFNIICCTEKYVLGGLDECTYIYDKMEKAEIFMCEFYGNCQAGVINDKDNWCVAAGNNIAIWKNGEVTVVDRKELRWVVDMRLKGSDIVEILIDPWSETASIWELNIEDQSFNKISDFDKYLDQPYCENPEW